MAARCDCCKGRREVLGLGGMVKKCLSCMGIGWKNDVVVASAAVVEEVVQVPEVLVTIDKRSREYRDNNKHKRS